MDFIRTLEAALGVTAQLDFQPMAPGDVPALAGALARVLGDAALRARLERQGQALYRRAFAMPRFFEQVAAIHARHFGVAAVPAYEHATQVPQRERAA